MSCKTLPIYYLNIGIRLRRVPTWGLHILRYVSVIQFIFQVLLLLPITLTQWNLCCISKSILKHHQKIKSKIKFPLSSLQLSEVHFCWFLIWIKSNHLFPIRPPLEIIGYRTIIRLGLKFDHAKINSAMTHVLGFWLPKQGGIHLKTSGCGRL